MADLQSQEVSPYPGPPNAADVISHGSNITSTSPIATVTDSAAPMNNSPLIKKRLSFADSFWSPDYLGGMNVLFDKLDQGTSENSQLLDFVAGRISLESAYASNLLSSIDSVSNSRSASSGFDRDEGASTKQAFVSFLDESSLQSTTHAQVAANLEKMVRVPFASFATNHKKQIGSARAHLSQAIKNYNKTIQKTKKAKETYYSKASQLEELTNSSVPVIVTTPSPAPPSAFSKSLAASKNFISGNATTSTSSPSSQTLASPKPNGPVIGISQNQKAKTSKSPNSPLKIVDTDSYAIIGGREYSGTSLSKLMQGLLSNIPRDTYKIPIIGSYEDVSSGEHILQYIRTSLGISNLGFAEEYGQSLIDHGFLRLVGSIGSTFSGTTNSKYQWLPKAIQLAQMASAVGTDSKQSSSKSNTRLSAPHQSPPATLGNSAVPASETSSNPTAADSSLDETASKMVKRTSNIVSGYFSNLLNNESEDASGTMTLGKGHRRQDSMPVVSGGDSSVGKTSRHSRTLSMASNISASLGVSSEQPRRESNISKLQREIFELDEKYQEAVQNLDEERCSLEQRIYEVLEFVQMREKERLREVRDTLIKFTNTLNTLVPSLHQSFQRMGMHSTNIDPTNDLDYLIERYKTGPFCPKPIVYVGFFGNSRKQSFGVDLKYVPFIIDEFINYIADEKNVLGSSQDSAETPIGGTVDFPSIDGTAQGAYTSRLTSSTSRDVLASLWSDSQSSITEIQELRQLINTGEKFDGDAIFPKYSLQVVISTFRELLLELPDNIIGYDAMKAMYARQSTLNDNKSKLEDVKTKTEQKISDFVKLLGILDRDDLAGLKTLISHLADVCEVSNETASLLSPPSSTRLSSAAPKIPPPIYLTEADIPHKVKGLAKVMAPYLVRPRVVTALTMTDKHPALVVQDLILYHDQIFSRINDRHHRAHENRRRSRSASGSEANRRQNIEERNKAIVAAAFKHGGGTGMTPSLSMSKLLALNRPSSPAPSNSSSSAPSSPPRNGPLPLTLSSGMRSKNLSLGSNEDSELPASKSSGSNGYSSDYNEGFRFGSSLSGARSNNGSSTNLQLPPQRGLHRKSSSTGKRLSMSFLDPPQKTTTTAASGSSSSGTSSGIKNVGGYHISNASIESTGSVASGGSSTSSSGTSGTNGTNATSGTFNPSTAVGSSPPNSASTPVIDQYQSKPQSQEHQQLEQQSFPVSRVEVAAGEDKVSA